MKRGNASVKSMLKVYKLEKDYDNYLRGINYISGSKKEDGENIFANDEDSDEGSITLNYNI